MEARVLIVEDDAELRGILVRGLAEEGFRAEATSNGADLLRRAVSAPADALVVDIGLPDTDGRDLCQALRAQGVETPVLFLTARDALVERLAGFRVGGDDYLTKPFAFAELVARLQALLRRGRPDAPAAEDGLRLDPTRHAVAGRGRERKLTPTEYRLLGRLMAENGGVVRRRELVGAGWPEGAIVHENTLDAYISRLRRKLSELEAPGGDRDGARRRLPARMSVRTRLFLAVVGAVVLAVAAMTIGFNLLLGRSLSHDASDLARARATAQLAALQPKENTIDPGDIPDQAGGESQFWVFSQGKTLRAPHSSRIVAGAARSLAGGGSRFLDVNGGDVRLYACRRSSRAGGWARSSPACRSLRTSRRGAPR